MEECDPSSNYLPQAKPYLPMDLISPDVSWIKGKPVFYDTCAKLYQALGHTMTCFNHAELSCYDHLNSSSFLEVMKQCLDPDDVPNFLTLQEAASINPGGARGLYKNIQAYYKKREISLHDYLYPNC
jgi:hypothetical protein